MNVPSGYTALGLIGFTDQGVYNSATAYVRNDIVHYNGNLWRCLVDDTTAVTPAEGANWTVYLAEPTSAAEDIIAPVEATATSTRIYVEGDQLILADVLYNVTQAIGIGDSLAVGTNIAAADTIVEQIAEKANSADLANVATSGNYSDLNGRPSLGTAAAKNVPASGDASTTEVVMGNDTRLTNARNAADVSAWAKAANKPTYNGSEISTSTAKTGTAQQSITDTVVSGTSMDNVVGTMLDNDKTLDTNVTSLKETLTNGLSNEVTVRANTGVHNILPFPFTQKSGTYKNVTYTDNGDGSITCNGQPNATYSQFDIWGSDIAGKMIDISETMLEPSKSYVVSAIGSGASNTTYRLVILCYDSSNAGVLTEVVTTEDKTITIPATAKYLFIRFDVIQPYTASNLVVKPMIKDANDAFVGYTKPALSNRQLSERKLSYKDNGVLGAKNFAKCEGTTQIIGSEVLFTVNDDGSVTANTVATTTAVRDFTYMSRKIEGGTYKISGSPSGSSNTTYCMWVGVRNSSDSAWLVAQFVYNDDLIFTVPADSSKVVVQLEIKSGQTVSNKTFYPLIRLASDTDPTYQPYAKTNQQLTKEILGLTGVPDNVNYNGCKNLLPMTLSGMKSINTAGTWSDNVYTRYGVSFEVLTDDSGSVIGINTNGTATSNESFTVAYLPSDLKTFRFNGIVGTSAGDSEYVIAVAVSAGSAFGGRVGNKYTNNDYVTTYTGTDKLKFCIGIANGYTVNNLKFYPMVRLATDTDPTFVPYAKSNKELTNKLDSLFTIGNQVVNASDGADQTVTLTPPTGFKTCLGVVGLISLGNVTAVSSLYQYNVGGNQLDVKWLSSAASNAKVQFKLLWTK